MSAPMVSAAAIIRSKYTNKTKYTSRYIMGQLTSATKSSVTYVDKLGDIHIYPELNIIDSLTYQPKPDLSFGDIYTFDSSDISSDNNSDGIAQPGETIDLELSIWNRWGTADDVTVKIDATSIGGVENPYVEFITDEITLDGEVGTFSSADNGYTYSDGIVSGVSNPLRFKIKEGTANDTQITFNLTVTAKNGMDSTDKNTYTDITSYTLTGQNGETLHGTLKEDTTLTSDKYWIIDNSLLVPEGVTLTVEPGTQIQFWSTDSTDLYASNAIVYIQVKGRFICNGTEDNPIEMFVGKGYEDRTSEKKSVKIQSTVV
jgi:hypothetical protein